MSELRVITGPMCSGKTTRLIEIANEYKNKYKVLYLRVIPGKSDNLDKCVIKSRNGAELNSLIDAFYFPQVDGKFDMNIVKEYEVIIIDEIQFFSFYDFSYILKLVNSGKTVICGGLNLDFRRVPFETTMELMAHADEIEKLKATCDSCGRKNAIYSHKESGDQEKRIEVDKSKYNVYCRKCILTI